VYQCNLKDLNVYLRQDDQCILRIGNDAGFYQSLILANEELKNLLSVWLEHAIKIECFSEDSVLRADLKLQDKLYCYKELNGFQIEFEPNDFSSGSYSYNFGIFVGAGKSSTYLHITKKDNLQLIVALQVWLKEISNAS
jgi:hypothetical protein